MDGPKPQIDPGPDHPITIQKIERPAIIRVGGITVARTDSYLELREANYPPVAYLPQDAISEDCLARSETGSWCPYKGLATYYHVRQPGGILVHDAAWSYETPFPAVAEIAKHLAFYPDRVDTINLG